MKGEGLPPIAVPLHRTEKGRRLNAQLKLFPKLPGQSCLPRFPGSTLPPGNSQAPAWRSPGARRKHSTQGPWHKSAATTSMA